MKILAKAAAVAVAVSTSALASDARKAIEETNGKVSEAVSKGDAKAIAALYTEDAIALPPDKPAARGRAAIQQLWSAFINGGLKQVKLTTDEVTVRDDVAVEVGAWKSSGATSEGKQWSAEGKYVVTWKNANGKWSLWRDIWNANSPPVRPSAQAAARPEPPK